MKQILQKTLMLAACMILVVFLISIRFAGVTKEMELVFELFGLAFLLSIIDFFFQLESQLPRIMQAILEYLLVSVIVLFYGYYFGWFVKANWWMTFLYVGIVYILGYILEIIRVKRDIEFINSYIQRRNQKEVDK